MHRKSRELFAEFSDSGYQNAPTFAYRIGEYEVDKNGMLTGPNDPSLIKWLWDEGFGPQE